MRKTRKILKLARETIRQLSDLTTPRGGQAEVDEAMIEGRPSFAAPRC